MNISLNCRSLSVPVMYCNENTEKKKLIYSYNEVETRLEDPLAR